MANNVDLTFVPLNQWASGLTADVLWDGAIADDGSGDGIPGSGGLNETPLNPVPIPVWPSGKAGDGLNEDGREEDGFPCNPACSGLGDGNGVDGYAEDGLSSVYFCWESSSVLHWLRDGTYRFAVRLSDQYGTPQTDALCEAEVTVLNNPRPPRNLRFVSWDAETNRVGIAWDASYDLLLI